MIMHAGEDDMGSLLSCQINLVSCQRLLLRQTAQVKLLTNAEGCVV